MATAYLRHPRLALGSLVLSLPMATGLTAQDTHPLAGVGHVSYEYTLRDTPVGSETATFLEDGWTVEGQFQRGRQTTSYSGRWTRGGGKTAEWQISGTRGPIRCSWNGQSIEVLAGTEKQPTARADWIHETAPVFYENLIWTVYSEMAVRLFENGVKVGDTLTLFEPRNQSEHVVTVRSIGQRQWHRSSDGALIDLRDLTFLLGDLEVQTTHTTTGLLVHLTVPSQQVRAVCKGYEGASPTGATLVDAGPWRTQLSRPNHQFQKQTGVRMAMRDGVELVADVFIPSGDGPWPTVLLRTPYGRAQPGRAQGAFWARRGYAFVVQDVRGCFDSGGEWSPAVHEKDDGSDTIDWIAAQDWSDQNVGMIGGSYGGWVQLLAAVSGNPHLKAIVPQVAPPDPLEAFPYEGGAFQLGVAWWAMVVDHLAHGAGEPLPSYDWNEVLATRPLTDLDQVLGIQQAALDEWLAHPPSDAEYWDRRSYQPHLAEADVAALHITGWYDGDLPGALQNYPALRAKAKSERSRNGQFLIVGPWGHAFNQSRRIGEVDFGPGAVVDLDSVYVRFFDRYLKGIGNGIDAENPVLAFVMGANEWITDTTWPLTNTRFTKLFLTSDGNARTRDGDGRLGLALATAGADTFMFDPADPPPTPEVTFGDPLKNSRLMDHSNTTDRHDVLDYTTAPLAQPVVVVGPVELVVWIQTDVADTDVYAKLLRIEPDGTTRRVTGGIQRLRYRNGPGTDAPVEPGTIVPVTVRLRATGMALATGDRLRLEVCSSEFPHFDVHPNTLELAASATELHVATTRVLHGPEHPSHLLLPVVTGEDARRTLRFEGEQDRVHNNDNV